MEKDYDRIFNEACLLVTPYLFVPKDTDFIIRLGRTFDNMFTFYRIMDYPSFLEKWVEVKAMIENYEMQDDTQRAPNIVYFRSTQRTQRENIVALAQEIECMKSRLDKLEKRKRNKKSMINEGQKEQREDNQTNMVIKNQNAPPLSPKLEERWSQIQPFINEKGYVTAIELTDLLKNEISKDGVAKLLQKLIEKGYLERRGQKRGMKYYPKSSGNASELEITQANARMKKQDKAPSKAEEIAYIIEYVQNNGNKQLKNSEVQKLLEEKFVDRYVHTERKHVHSQRVLKELVDEGLFKRIGKTSKTIYTRTDKPI